MSEEILGVGFAYPLEVDPLTGGLKINRGIDLVWDSIESIIDTPPLTAAGDPTYGFALSGYESISDVGVFATRLANAIAAAEPRIADLTLEIQTIKAGTLLIAITVVPIGSLQPDTRIFPFFQAVT
jgi:hypothetical protein